MQPPPVFNSLTSPTSLRRSPRVFTSTVPGGKVLPFDPLSALNSALPSEKMVKSFPGELVEADSCTVTSFGAVGVEAHPAPRRTMNVNASSSFFMEGATSACIIGFMVAYSSRQRGCVIHKSYRTETKRPLPSRGLLVDRFGLEPNASPTSRRGARLLHCKRPRIQTGSFGGPLRTRTERLRLAKAALYQMS